MGGPYLGVIVLSFLNPFQSSFEYFIETIHLIASVSLYKMQY